MAIFGYKTCNLPNLHRLALVKRLVINMQIPRDDNKNKLDDFLTPEVDDRQVVLPSPMAKFAKKDPEYKMEHHEIYESFNIPWPPAEDVMVKAKAKAKGKARAKAKGKAQATAKAAEPEVAEEAKPVAEAPAETAKPEVPMPEDSNASNTTQQRHP